MKDVSGWVECREVRIDNEIPVENLEKLYYNPIRDPQWRRESDCGEFAWDGSEYETLITNNRQVYILESMYLRMLVPNGLWGFWTHR